jgi:LPXTG-site transpeptidase (sortase) family protein
MKRLFAGLVSGAVIACSLVFTTASANLAGATALTARFVSVDPSRLLDTRVGTGAPARTATPNGIVNLAVAGHGGVPATGATAVVLNVTVTAAAGAGFVTVFPGGTTMPQASNLNMDHAGQTVANLVTVPVGSDGSVSFVSSVGTHLIADVFGYYMPASAPREGRFIATGPSRIFDSRGGAKVGAGAHLTVGLAGTAPADATAVVVNITAVDAGGAGFWTVWANGKTQPGTSNLNTERAGHVIANQAIVPVGPGGLDVFTSSGGHLLVDVTGYFTGASAPASINGLFVSLPPTRVLDTRSAGDLNPLGPSVKAQAAWNTEIAVAGRLGIPSDVSGVVANVTIVAATTGGFVTAYPARTVMPDTSTANAAAGQTVPNHAIIPVTSHGFSLFSSGGAHLIADLSGWFTGPSRPETTQKPLNAGPALPVRLVVSSGGIDEVVNDGIDDATISTGPGHWPGSSLPGQPGTFTVFGHRVSHTHPFVNLNLVKIGDVILVTDRNNVVYRYLVERTDILSPTEIGKTWAGDSAIELIACHPPGSIDFRIVVRGRLVSAA